IKPNHSMPTLKTNNAVNNIADLQTLTGNANGTGETIEVLGYYNPAEGGGGIFYGDHTYTETDNTGTIIDPGITTGRWIRGYEGVLNIKWFGAKGDGSNDTAAFLAAVQLGEPIYVPESFTYYALTTSLTLTNDMYGKGNAALKFSSIACLICGEDNISRSKLTIESTANTGSVASGQ